METGKNVRKLREEAEKYNLRGVELLEKYSDAELAKWYNGAGPDSWPEEFRHLLTTAMELFAPVVLIHDVQYTFSDGTDEGFNKTVKDWKENCQIIFDAEYPFWTIRQLDREYRLKRTYWWGIMKASTIAISSSIAAGCWRRDKKKNKKKPKSKRNVKK